MFREFKVIIFLVVVRTPAHKVPSEKVVKGEAHCCLRYVVTFRLTTLSMHTVNALPAHVQRDVRTTWHLAQQGQDTSQEIG